LNAIRERHWWKREASTAWGGGTGEISAKKMALLVLKIAKQQRI
jgi:hypothetical protein